MILSFAFFILNILIFLMISVSGITKCHFDFNNFQRNTIVYKTSSGSYLTVDSPPVEFETLNSIEPGSGYSSFTKPSFSFNAHYTDINNNTKEQTQVRVSKIEGYNIKDSSQGICITHFEESGLDSGPSNVTKAVVRIIESCIQAEFCNPSLYEIDNDVDVYYQSVQSSMNALADFYIPIVMSNYINDKGILALPEGACQFISEKIGITVKSGELDGLATIDRTTDISISDQGNLRYKIVLGLRFDQLKLSLHFWTFTATLSLKKPAMRITVIINYNHEPFKVSVENVEMLALENMKLEYPIMGSGNYDINWLQNKINEAIKDYSFNFIKYKDIIPESMQEYLIKKDTA